MNKKPTESFFKRAGQRWAAGLIFAGLLALTTEAVRADEAGAAKPAGKKPLKVFIMAGQSNMEGPAYIRTFDYIGDDPATAPMLQEMLGPDGKPKVCDDVWISYLTGKPFGDRIAGEGFGKLTAGYGARENPTLPGEKIGPEFTFGIYANKMLHEPILIIKTAWGGKSLNTDFRPPSAGPYVPNALEIQHKRFATEEQRQEKIAETGVYYRFMIEHVTMVLKDIKRVYPGYDEQQGYELAGFIWLQGWNDMCERDVYGPRPGSQTKDYSKYSEWLGDLIRDVRKDVSAPKLPFVIGVLGCDGVNASEQTKLFRQAMAAPAADPEFQGNVAAVQMSQFWDERLGAIYAKQEKVRDFGRSLDGKVKAGTMTPAEKEQAVDKLRGELISPAEQALWDRGASDGNYHYLGCAKTFALAGKAFAETVLAMQPATETSSK